MGCVALRGREKGSYVVAAGTRLGLLDWDSQQVTWVAQLDRHRPHDRFNDGKADPAGRFVAGGHRRDCGLPRPLPLLTLPPLGQTRPTSAETPGTPGHPDGPQSSVPQGSLDQGSVPQGLEYQGSVPQGLVLHSVPQGSVETDLQTGV